MKKQDEYIKYYIRGGIKIFPCRSNEKAPLITGWQNKATSNQEVIDTWWREYPNANIYISQANLVKHYVNTTKLIECYL